MAFLLPERVLQFGTQPQTPGSSKSAGNLHCAWKVPLMLTVWGKLFRNNKCIASDTFESASDDISDALIECLEHFGRVFDMEVPMWSSIHTKQFGGFQKVRFTKDDFIDRVGFDRFEIQVLDQN